MRVTKRDLNCQVFPLFVAPWEGGFLVTKITAGDTDQGLLTGQGTHSESRGILGHLSPCLCEWDPHDL